MKYKNIQSGSFLARPNRFVAKVLIQGKTEIAHVKNTGRCKELLVPGAKVYLENFTGNMGKRKLRYSLICVQKGDMLINMDSQAPNAVAKEALEQGKLILPGMGLLNQIKGEQTYGGSRLDFCVEDTAGQKGWVEVKGVTLEESGVAKFPDAPTQRGVKHVEELIKITKSGYKAYILFVIQMKGPGCFKPNDQTDPDFGEALRKAESAGASILAYDCLVTANSLCLDKKLEIQLK